MVKWLAGQTAVLAAVMVKWLAGQTAVLAAVMVKWSARQTAVLAAVMVKWSAGQTAVLTKRVRAPHECSKVFSAVQGHCTAAFYDANTGPTEFISIVNSVKMVNMP